MTIEIITGSPGAGKTTFAVWKRLRSEVGRELVTDDGTIVKRRVIVSGIRGLLLEHERVPHRLTADEPKQELVDFWNEMRADMPDEPVHQRLAGSAPHRNAPELAQTWWLWCKPGDLIVIDEVQFMAPRGSLGRKPPYWIEAMAIHRHYGVDFIVITQHPQMIDTFIRNLCGLHRHVRSVMGSPVCMVYVWDHASNPERVSLANKTFYIRRPKHYRLFKSSVAHVKPPTAGRSALVVVPALALFVAFGVSAFKEKFNPSTAPAAVASTSSASSSTRSSSRPAAATVATAELEPKQALQGCWSYRERCECQDQRGFRVVVDLGVCRVSAASYDGLVKWAPRVVPPLPSPTASQAGAGAAAPSVKPLSL